MSIFGDPSGRSASEYKIARFGLRLVRWPLLRPLLRPPWIVALSVLPRLSPSLFLIVIHPDDTLDSALEETPSIDRDVPSGTSSVT